jgi:transcriptional regulator with PAS, ATPase and Fis domain
LIVQNSEDSILYLNLNEIIEKINPSVSSLLSYQSGQLLGQHLSSILISEECGELFIRITLMKEDQCSMIFEDHILVLSETEAFIPVHATLLGITKDSQLRSFVLILRDETLLQTQMKEEEEAKARSEGLLYSILPRDIVIRLNQGEKDISFSVPSVSVVFVDIEKFSEFYSHWSPNQICH